MQHLGSGWSPAPAGNTISTSQHCEGRLELARRRPSRDRSQSKGVRQLEEMKHDLIGVVGQDHVVDDTSASKSTPRRELCPAVDASFRGETWERA